MDRSLPEQMVAQGVVVVGILAAVGETEDALTQELLLSVRDEGRMLRVRAAPGSNPGSPRGALRVDAAASGRRRWRGCHLRKRPRFSDDQSGEKGTGRWCGFALAGFLWFRL